MENAYRDTKRVLLQARNQLDALECASANAQLPPQASALVAASLHANLQQLGAHSAALRSLLAAQPPARQHVWKARLDDVRDQIAELRAREARCDARFRSIRNEHRMREELFQRRGGGGGGGGGAVGVGASTGGDTVLRMGVVQENRSLKQSGRLMSGILATGAGALDSLLSQKGRLRNVRTKVLDVMSQVGVDRRIIARIERREWSDTVLVYSLMALLLLLLALAVLYKYQRR